MFFKVNQTTTLVEKNKNQKTKMWTHIVEPSLNSEFWWHWGDMLVASLEPTAPSFPESWSRRYSVAIV